jgi:hypothetical protein
VTGVALGRVGAAVQQITGGGGYTAGAGYGHLLNTSSDGKLGAEDKSTPSDGSQTPKFVNANPNPGKQFGISWAAKPSVAQSETPTFGGAVAGGNGPTPAALSAIGGAGGTGSSPTRRSSSLRPRPDLGGRRPAGRGSSRRTGRGCSRSSHARRSHRLWGRSE